MTSHKKVEVAKKMGNKTKAQMLHESFKKTKRPGFVEAKRLSDMNQKIESKSEKEARWKADAIRAKAQFDRLHNSQFRGQSAMTPARRAWEKGNK